MAMSDLCVNLSRFCKKKQIPFQLGPQLFFENREFNFCLKRTSKDAIENLLLQLAKSRPLPAQVHFIDKSLIAKCYFVYCKNFK